MDSFLFVRWLPRNARRAWGIPGRIMPGGCRIRLSVEGTPGSLPRKGVCGENGRRVNAMDRSMASDGSRTRDNMYPNMCSTLLSYEVTPASLPQKGCGKWWTRRDLRPAIPGKSRMLRCLSFGSSMENGGTRRTCTPSRGVRDVILSRETRHAWPVRVPWSRWQDLHPH